jgi:2-haloacid dehalogenase
LGDRWEPLSDIWRTKQLQYTWLRSLMGRYADFHHVTRDALDFAMDAVGLADPALADRLMALYERLDAYPEVPDLLRALKTAGKQTAILSNGSPGMLRSAVDAAGLGSLVDDQLSVDTLQVYKPHPDVYALATSRFGVAPAEVAFFSSNGWDAAGAAAFGFRVVWINRFGQGRERLPVGPEIELNDLRGVAGLFEV